MKMLEHPDREIIPNEGVPCVRCQQQTVRYQWTDSCLIQQSDYIIQQGKTLGSVFNLYTDFCENPECKTGAITNIRTKIFFDVAADKWLFKHDSSSAKNSSQGSGR
jgi:hypothetical protein